MVEKNRDKTGRKTYLRYIGYGVGAIGMDLSYGLFNTFLFKYFTDILLILPSYIALMSFAARIWDGINDPMMGTIVDNTRSKYGKFRPWILLGAVLNAVVLVFLFTNPGFRVDGKVNVGLYAYVALMCVLWDMSNTIVDIPYWSMVPTLTTDPQKRNIVATIPRFFSGLGQIVIIILSPLMIPLLGNTEGLNQKGYTYWTAICGLFLILGCTVTFFSTRQITGTIHTEEPEERFTLRKAYQTVKNNDQLLIFMLVAILSNTGWYLVNGLSTYYFEDVLGNLNLISLFGMIAGGGQAAGLVLLPTLSRKMERNTVIKLALIGTIVGYFGMYFFGSVINFFPLFALFGVVCCMGVGCSFVSQTVMLADIVDYGAWKLGYRSDSIVFSMKSLLQKVAYSIQSLVIGFGLSLSHYNGALSAQPDSAKTGISMMMFLIPPLLSLCALLLFSAKYKLDGAKMRQVKEELEAK